MSEAVIFSDANSSSEDEGESAFFSELGSMIVGVYGDMRLSLYACLFLASTSYLYYAQKEMNLYDRWAYRNGHARSSYSPHLSSSTGHPALTCSPSLVSAMALVFLPALARDKWIYTLTHSLEYARQCTPTLSRLAWLKGKRGENVGREEEIRGLGG